MRFPTISTALSKRSAVLGEFKGLNQQLICGDGEWSSMKNISDRFYPAIASRPERGLLPEEAFENPKGILYKNGLFHIDGEKAYYKGAEKFTVSDTDKIIVGMGAYICVFPDGIIYNTFTDTKENIAVTYNQTSTITFAPLSTKSAYTKITASGLHNYFSKGDNVDITGCTNKSYDGTHIITDSGTDYIVISGALASQFTQDSGLTFKRNMPELDYVVERGARLWGCSSKNHEVYCCKANDPKNWYAYETGADMAWAANVGSDGDFTACTKYSTYVLFFKESTVHILRGEKPANFSLTEKELPGVRMGCSKSVQNIDEVLYYVGRNGVYAFDGALPKKISENITEEISDGVASQYDGKYYLSCKLGGKQTLLVYDPKIRVWDVENDETFKFAANSEGVLHFVDASNNLTEIYGNRDEKIEWSLESGDIEEGLIDMKYVSKIRFNFWLSLGTELTVYMKYDDEPMWHKKGFIRSTKNKTYTLPVIPKRCSKYRFKIEGKGQFKLLAMAKDVEQGSEINGSLQYQHHR